MDAASVIKMDIAMYAAYAAQMFTNMPDAHKMCKCFSTFHAAALAAPRAP
jgi:hypothetical protein